MTYLETCGVAFNAVVAIVVIYMLSIAFIIPALEALSMCRWYMAMGRLYPSVKPTKAWFHVWWSCFEFGGRAFSATSNKYGRWEGIGQWRVYSEDENE